MTETTNWIPCDDNLPGHRPPTEADVDDDRQIELQLPDTDGGFFYHRQTYSLRVFALASNGEAIHAVAWRPLPKSRPAEPYVPPEPEPTKPREWWQVFDQNGNRIAEYVERDPASVCADDVNGTYCLMREVMPGDPTPEDVERLQLKYDNLKVAFDHALECVDRVFQESAKNPNPILGDRCHLGEDKFDQVVRLAEEVAEAIADLKDIVEVESDHPEWAKRRARLIIKKLGGTP